ncbi:MAG: hypothetical protein ACYDCL_02520 [Myxococcales bacterium]
MSGTLKSALLLGALATAGVARADAPDDRFSIGGYFRLQALTDFQGGNGRLGVNQTGCGYGGPCIYGRLLNEGPYAIVQSRLSLIGTDNNSSDPWAAVTMRIEGSSFLGTDAGKGSLSDYAITNFGVDAGNILLPNVTWRLGVLWYEPNDLDLYDMFIDDLFYGVAGVSAHYQIPWLDLLIGAGDAGWSLHPNAYDTVYTAGGWFRVHPSKHFEFGGGGQFGYEPASPGNQNGPYQTLAAQPNANYAPMTYLQYYRQDAAQSFFQNAAPGTQLLPNPSPRSSENWKAVGYLGFGKWGPFQWNSLYVHYLKNPPLTNYQESYGGQSYTIYVHDLTDQSYELMIGDEMLITLIPKRLDLALAGLYGSDRNYTDTMVAGYDNYDYVSGVARAELYLTQTVHLLFESSLAHEHSINGNLFRNHVDSLFQNDGTGVEDPLGLQYGDSPDRDTWQGKLGVVFSPKGLGIYTRPSLRLLYGIQYSTAQDAFQSGYVNNLNQYNEFVGPEQHWHSVFGADLEGWF